MLTSLIWLVPIISYRIIYGLCYFPNDISSIRHILVPISSMIKRVLGQPNFSPQTNATQLFPQINTNFNNLSSVKVNTNI